jgi:CRISPR/Cas system CSM-associated protein Csm3 (group 7 of RAMP superfamily)
VIFHEWQAGRLKIGAGKSRGLGTLELTGAHEHHVHLSTSDGLAAYLKRHSAPLGWQPKTIPVPDRRYHDEYQRQDGAIQSWITFEFDLEIQGFFLTDDTTTAVMAGVDACSLNFLPGASLRGVIRSQAERIARTLANLKANSEEEFLERCAASDPFATRAGKGIQSSAARIRASENYNELRTDENNFDLAEQLFGSVEWGSRLSVEDAPKLSDAGRKKLDFVAIDRFTGGAAEGAKFDAEALWKPVFKCKLHLESPEAWEIGWLLYTLRDLADGRVTVGAGGRKGFGRTSIGQLTVTLGYTYPKAAPFSGVSETGDGFYIEAPTTIENLKEVPTELLQPYDDKIAEYRVAVAHTNSVDPYWGTSAKDLYRKETSLDDILKSS